MGMRCEIKYTMKASATSFLCCTELQGWEDANGGHNNPTDRDDGDGQSNLFESREDGRVEVKGVSVVYSARVMCVEWEVFHLDVNHLATLIILATNDDCMSALGSAGDPSFAIPRRLGDPGETAFRQGSFERCKVL